MAWLNLAEDLAEEFSGLQAWDYGPPEPVPAFRRSPPPDARRAALERQATALLRAAEPRKPKPPVPWTPARAEEQRQRRQEARRRSGPSRMGPKAKNAWKCGPWRPRTVAQRVQLHRERKARGEARRQAEILAEAKRRRESEKRRKARKRSREQALREKQEALRKELRARFYRKSLQARTG